MSEAAPTTPEGVARTPTGEIASQTQTTTPEAKTPQTSTTPTEQKPSLANEPGESLVNQKPPAEPPKGEGAPTEYAKFTVPDGYELDEGVAKEATVIFKEMNLSQTQAQKLVDFYTAKTNESVNQPYELWQETQDKWVKEVKSDPILGPKLNEVKVTISRAIDGLGDPKLAQDFRAAMDYTGAGNNPAFIRAFYKLAQMVTEGGHVAGGGPSPESQKRAGEIMSAAKAMYPNLP
jgi:antitoxin component of RelBE/YafQ-DinJ toxin-antitoxin module